MYNNVEYRGIVSNSVGTVIDVVINGIGYLISNEFVMMSRAFDSEQAHPLELPGISHYDYHNGRILLILYPPYELTPRWITLQNGQWLEI